ncbi:MAG: Dabb family protein [Mailhella sp.]|jgi:Stress responsive A/B Barrel Domain.|nr:Dabb family protein [Mailhella sp.]
MIHHVVWWTLKDGVNGKSAKEAADCLVKLGMEKMAGKIDVLLSLEMTAQFAKTTTQEMQLLLHSTHKDEQALAEYAAHPVHVEFAGELKQYASSRQAIDYIV